MQRKSFVLIIVALTVGVLEVQAAPSLSEIEQLGKLMFQDLDFSLNHTQSCRTCHHPTAGFADPTNSRDPYYTVVSLGDDGVSLGGRNAPTAAYAGYSPVLQQRSDGEYVGGMFWDGRATGWTLGDPLAEQAQGPPLNPVEMNMPDEEAVVEVVRNAGYANFFIQVFGIGSLDDVYEAYDNIGRAIAAYERSVEVQQFSSRFDMNVLTEQEISGMELFELKCTKCHAMDGPDEKILFTNYTYQNLGIPVNPLLADNPTDLGLGGFLRTLKGGGKNAHLQDGKFKVPTLRNVGISAPYGHNGYFPTLRKIVEFKNSRDVAEWETPEVTDNLNMDIGSMGLDSDQIDDIVAFLMALTDN